MGKKPRLTFRKNYKIKRAIRNKQRLQEDGSEAEDIEMNADTISRENSVAPTSVLSTSSEDTPTLQPSQLDCNSLKEDTVCTQQIVTCRNIQQTREYRKGDYVLIKVDRRVPLMVFSVQCVVNNGVNGKVRGLVYARPDDTPHKRQHYHGEHELLVFYKPVTFSCAQLLKMEQPSSTEWDVGLPLGPPPPSPPSPTASSVSHSSSTVALYCNEDMEAEDCSSSHSSGNSHSESDTPKFHMLAVSYSKYCRYRAVLKRLGAAAYRLMDQPLVQAMGGLSGQYYTRLVFTRKTFRDMTLERKLELLVSDNTLSVLAKRTSTKADSSNGSTLDSMRPPPTKRQRGRPRKHRLNPLGPSSSCSSTMSSSKKRLKLMMPSRRYSSSQHEGTPLPHTITKRGDHHLRNRAAIQRPVYFRDSFFALEDAIAYAKMQSKHMERKKKASTTCTPQPTAKAPSKSAQDQSNNQNHDSPSPSPLPSPEESSPKKVSPPPSSDTAARKTHTNDSSSRKAHNNDTSSHKGHTVDKSSHKTLTDDTSSKKLTDDTTPHNDSTTSNVSQSSLPNLEKYLVSEKAFMELLMCFMRMMKTPLKQVPKLGSKEMSLYELYKVTSSLGGYDEVTSRCQWDVVHKILGYGILCSPNTVREHYYEFLVPFEKALSAMQSSTK